MKKEILQEITDNQSFIKFYKCLSFIIGIKESILLQDLITKDKYFQLNNKEYDNWFYNTSKNIYYDTSIPIDSQKRIIDSLKKQKLILTKLIGLPRKKYFKINYDKVNEIFEKGIEKRKELYNSYNDCSSSVKMTEQEPLEQPNLSNNKNKLNRINNKVSKDTSVSDEEDFSNEKSHHQENTDKYDLLKDKQKKHSISSKLDKNNTPRNKYILNKDQKNKIFPIIKMWNKNNNTSNHSVNRNSKVLFKIYNYIESLMDGSFIKNYNIPSEFLTKIKADRSELKKGLSINRIIEGINNYLLEFEPGYYPFSKKEKDKLPKSLEHILYNLYNGCISIFLKVLYSPPKFVDDMVSTKKDKYPKITKLYLEKFLEKDENELSILEKNKLIKNVNEIVQEYKDICSFKIKVDGKNIKRSEIETSNFHVNLGTCEDEPGCFISNHIEYLNSQKKYNTKFNVDIDRLKVNGYWWGMFEKWYKKTFNITFFPDKEYLKMKAENLLNIF